MEKLNLNFKNKGEPGYESTPLNKTNMNKITGKVDEIVETINSREVISVGFTAQKEITNAKAYEYQALIFDKVICKAGSNLSLNKDGFIVIGDNINHVLISFTMCVNGNSVVKGVQLLKNSAESLMSPLYIQKTPAERDILNISPILMEVKKGDKIGICYIYPGSITTFTIPKSTCVFTIEKID